MLAGLVARSAIDGVMPQGFPFLTFFPAIVLVTFLCGLGPGIACAILSGLAAWYVFIPPRYSFEIDTTIAVALAFYALVVAVDIALIHGLRRAAMHLAASRSTIRALNASLEQQVATRTTELQRSAALQSAILANAGYAIVATDQTGTITLFNPAAERLVGYTADQVIGTPALDLFHHVGGPDGIPPPADRHADAAARRFGNDFNAFAARIPAHAPKIRECTLRSKQGALLPVLLNVSRLTGGDEEDIGILCIAADLSERYQHAAEMRAANAGTWSYDIVSGRVHLSAECARQHGLPDAEIEIDTGTQWRALAHPDDVEPVLADLARAIETGESYTTEFRVPLPGGRVRWLTAIGRVEPATGGRSGHVLGLTLDITARKEAERAVIEARCEAERANRAKTEFLAAMSHEIRTPLNAIVGFTDLMLGSDRLPPDALRHVELIRSAGCALMTVVNDILDFSKVEAGAVALNLQPFSPSALAEGSTAIVRGLAARKGLELRLVLDGTLPPTLLGDEARLRQVLLNLLNNAVKFTAVGSVVLKVLHTGSGPAGESLRFEVSDTGIGISDAKRGRLFQRFSQADGSTERAFGGTGLGLAISKALVTLMEGEIGFDSTEGKGSTFWCALTLPRAEPAATQAEPTGASVRRGRLLLVEDNLLNQELVQAVLEEAGHTVDVAGDGEEAIRAIRQTAYDVVLMDVQMPGMDGLSATRAIRDLPGPACRVPVIGMSASVLPAEIELCHDAGMDDHMGKPFRREKLIEIVDRWLVEPPSGARGETAGRPAASLPDDQDAGQHASLGDAMPPGHVQQVLDLLLNDLRRSFVGPAHTAEARARLRLAAHSMASAAAMVGLETLALRCREVEAFGEGRIVAEGAAAFGARLTALRQAAREAARKAEAEIQRITPTAEDAGGNRRKA